MYKKYISSLIFCLYCSINSFGQNPDAKIIKTNTNLWMSYIGSHKISPKWSAFADIQWRRNDLLSNPMQVLLRPGIIYHVNGSTSIGGGYAYIITEPYGVIPVRTTFTENRAWQQVMLINTHGLVEVNHRFRLEQRWVKLPITLDGINYEEGPSVYFNRARYSAKASLPINNKKMQPKTIYATVANEVMLNWGENVRLNTFDQNRFFLGLGYIIPKLGRMEVLYLNQAIMRGDGKTIEQNHTINLTLGANFSLLKTPN